MSDTMVDRKIVLAENHSAPMAWDAIKNDKHKVIDRIRAMIVNGKKLNDNEVYALTSFSLANDLNPFNGEAFFIPGSGPVPGIQGFRKKSKMALRIEAKEAQVRAPFFTEEYELITDPKEAGHDPEKGDIAYRCYISDNVSQQGHADIFTDAMAKLIKAGLDVNQAYHAAEKIAGSKPVWTGIGIVYGDEKFGGREMFARHERAMKRAAKLAIKKRWPSLDLPSSSDDFDYVEPEIIVSEPEPQQLEEPKQKRSAAEILDDLGFTPNPEKIEKVYKKEPEPQPAYEEGQFAEEPDDEAYEEPEIEYPKTQAELMSLVAKGNVPYIGVKDAKEILDRFKGNLKLAWDEISSVAEERSLKAHPHPDLLF